MDFNYQDFMNRLHNQTTGGEEASRARQDRAIMRVLISWARKQTPEFDSFREKGGSKASYLGDHDKKAGVEKDIAWEKTELFLLERFDRESVEDNMKEEFDTAYSDALEDPWWRESKFSGVK